jgi:putative peptidoglycan lipid II flippase
MMASLALSRLLGLLRDTVMAGQFGITIDTDSYRLAVAVPDMIFFLIAGGGLSSAFIPVFSEFLHTDRERDAWKVFSVVTTLSAIAVSVLIAIAWVFAPQIAGFMAAGKTFQAQNGQIIPFGPREIENVVLMSRIMLPAQFSFMVGSILLATLYARNRFVAPGVAPNIYNVGIIIGAMVGPTLGLGIAGMSWGALIGAAVGNLLLPILVMLKLGGHFMPSLDFHAPGVRKFFKLLLPVIFGFSLPSMAALITQKFASVYGVGANTVLNLSNNLMQAPLGIFGQSLALAAFPVLAEFYATKRMPAYRKQISKTILTIIYLSVPSSLFLYAMAPELVQVIYGYGHAKQGEPVSVWMGPAMPEQLANVVVALRWYTLGIFAWCIQPMLMRGFFSIHQTLRPVILSTLMTALFIFLCWASLGSTLGFISLPIASNIAAILLMVLLWLALEWEIKGKLDRKGGAIVFIQSTAAATVMALVGWAIFRVVPHSLSKIVFVPIVLAVMCICGWVYYWVTKAFKMPESEYFVRALKRMDRRKRPIAPVESEVEAG